MASPQSESAWRLDRGDDGTATVWFDQPDRAENVLDLPALDQFDEIMSEAVTDASIEGIVLRSAKPAGFCAGSDLKAILACQTPEELKHLLRRGWAVLDRLSSFAKPTAAVIHGVCLGGGLELALACRRRAALASSAPIQIGTPEVQLGLVPGWGAISRLPRLIGPDDGLDLLITGRSIGFLLARSLGIVDRLTSGVDLDAAAELLQPAPGGERTWPKEEWEAAWNRARDHIDQQPGAFAEAQLQILTILSIELAHGSAAAREATVATLFELAMSDIVRETVLSALD